MKTKFSGILTLFLAFVVQITFAQEKTISGVVSDENGLPLPAATIVVKGTSNGTSTDFDGNYSITANQGDVLQFSYVGYATLESTVDQTTTISVTLQPDNELEEVIVTAVGIKRKPDEITTANQVVKSEEITQAVNPNVVQSLAGKVSGLQINTTSTGVNQGTQIILRGSRSISGRNQALVVIDNIISSSGVLATIDPNIIESINVLKGANGAALYGERGAAGVIIVTTKKGTKDGKKFEVNLSSSITIEDIAYLPETQDRYGQGWSGELDWTDQGSWGPQYDGSTQAIGVPYPGVTDWRYGKYEHIEDNIRPFFNTGVITQNSIGLSSGDSDGYLNLSALRQDTKGLIPNDKRTKNNLSLTVGKTAGKFSVSAIARYQEDTSDTAFGGIYGRLSNTPGNIPVERFNSGNNDDHWTLYDNSPYWTIANQRSKNKTTLIDLSSDIKYDLNENINFILRSSVRYNGSIGTAVSNRYTQEKFFNYGTFALRPSYNKAVSDGRFIYTDFMSNFDYNLTDNITLKANIGLNVTDTKTNSLSVGGLDSTLDNFDDLSNVGGIFQASETKAKTRTAGAFANLDLGYKNYLYLNATARNDWNSVLPKNNNSFFYNSVGVSFIPTKAFPSIRSNTLNKVKISGGWVKTANAGAVPFGRLAPRAFQGNGYPFILDNRNSFILENSLVDKDITPEFVTNTEANINIELFKKIVPRLTIDASYSFGENTDQLLNITSSGATGFGSILTNIGKTKSTALEVDLGFTPIKTENFEWNNRIGYSTFKTIVKKVTDESDVVSRGSLLAAVEGEELFSIRGTAYTRDAQGRVELDANGNPTRSSTPQILGKTTPDYILNFSTEFKYKGFRLAAVADFRTGHQFYSGIKQQLSFQGRTIESAAFGRNPFLYPNSTVKGTNTTNTTVLTSANTANGAMLYYQQNYSFFNENFVLDATAFKLREVSLSYEISPSIIKNIGLSRMNVGVSGRNLLTITPKDNRNYNDPEIGGGIGGYSQTPPTRFYTFSVNLSF